MTDQLLQKIFDLAQKYLGPYHVSTPNAKKMALYNMQLVEEVLRLRRIIEAQQKQMDEMEIENHALIGSQP